MEQTDLEVRGKPLKGQTLNASSMLKVVYKDGVIACVKGSRHI